jgi:molybdopterin-guanine dinucleotide biosynthesis protein A
MNDIVGLVLAGGRSRRFNGQDKGWQLYQGKPLIEHALLQLQGCACTVISANHAWRYCVTQYQFTR